MAGESPPGRDDRTEFHKSQGRAREWADTILKNGIENSCSDVALDVRVFDPRFAQYADMLEHIKAEYFNYVRDKYGNTNGNAV